MILGIIGCGNMGLAYAKSIVKADLVAAKDLHIFEKHEERAKFLCELSIGQVYAEITPVLSECDLVILAVKPQTFPDLAKELSAYIKPEQVVVSIMAGTTIESIASGLNHKKIVRAMPNTPCQIGYGITGYFVNFSISEKENQQLLSILSSTGKIIEVKEEGLINSITAISGSGPAYFFFILKEMISTAEKLGLSSENAFTLVTETMRGAYHLSVNAEDDLETLIKAVTSKGGTTEAALKTFVEKGLDKAIDSGLTAAKNRAEELAK